jgi:hypothetical protein
MRVLLRYGGRRRALRAFYARLELVDFRLARRVPVRSRRTVGCVLERRCLAEKEVANDRWSQIGSLPRFGPFVMPLAAPPPPEGARGDLDGTRSITSSGAPQPPTGLRCDGRTELHRSAWEAKAHHQVTGRARRSDRCRRRRSPRSRWPLSSRRKSHDRRRLRTPSNCGYASGESDHPRMVLGYGVAVVPVCVKGSSADDWLAHAEHNR